MIRKLILAAALACASSAALAAPDPFTWIFKNAPESGTVHLYYGEPESSTISVEVRCTPKSGAIEVRVPIPDAEAKARKGKVVTGTLVAPGGQMTAKGLGAWEDDAEEGFAEFAPGPGFAKLLERDGKLTLTVVGQDVDAPLDPRFRRAFKSFTNRCPIGSWS